MHRIRNNDLPCAKRLSRVSEETEDIGAIEQQPLRIKVHRLLSLLSLKLVVWRFEFWILNFKFEIQALDSSRRLPQCHCEDTQMPGFDLKY